MKFSFQSTASLRSKLMTRIGSIVAILAVLASLFMFWRSIESEEASVTWFSLTAHGPHRACDQDTLAGSLTIGGAATNVTIEVGLPQGVEYVPGSAVFSGGATLMSEVATNPARPVFTISNPAGKVDFFLLRNTSCDAYQTQIGGGKLVDTVRVFEAGVQISADELSNQYALSYGVLSLGPATTTPSNALIGDKVTRTMTITNGNFGAIDTFWFAEVFAAGNMMPDSFRINPSGVNYLIPASQVVESSTGDSVYVLFGPNEIQQIGDGDAFLENGETIQLSYRITLTGCGNGSTVLSNPTVWWGCGGNFCQNYQQSAGITITQAEPNLAYTIDVHSSGCLGYGAAPDTIVIEIVNSGSGPATDIEFGFQTQHPTVSGFDVSQISWELDDGSTGTVTATDLTDPVSNEFQCATDWPGPGALYSNGKIAPDVVLPAASTMWVRLLSYSCCPSVCLDPAYLPSNSTYFGTSYRVDGYFRFKNQCGINQQDLGPGSLTSQTMSMAYSLFTPPNLFDGASSTYTYLDFTEFLISDLFDDLSDVEFELEVVFPECVLLSGDLSAVEWVAKDGVTTYAFQDSASTDSSFRITWDPSTMTGGGAFTLSGTQIRFPVEADCSGGSCTDNGVQLNFTVKPGQSCGSTCELMWICETISVDVLCPGPAPDGGGQLLSSVFYRENLGAPDADNNGCPDDDNNCNGAGAVSATPFNEGLVRRERALAGDTILSYAKGVILSGSVASSWPNLYFENQLSDKSVMDILETSIRFVDATDGAVYTTSGISPTVVNDTVRVNLSISTVRSALGLPSAVNSYGADDTVEVTIRYRLNDNLSSTTQSITTNNRLYAAVVSSPTISQRYDVATTRGAIIAGKPGTSTYKSWITFPSGCSSKNIGFNTEVALDGAAVGNNFFPFEYRVWARPQKFIVTLPEGYTFDRVRLNHKRTTGNGTSSANFYTGDILMTGSSLHPDGAVTYEFDIEDPANAGIWAGSGGNYFYGDDGAFFRYVAEVSPGCSSPASWQSDLAGGNDYLQKHQYVDVLGETQNRTGSTNLFFNKPSLSSSCAVPTKEGVTSEVEWEVNVSNLSSNIPVQNGWISLYSPSGQIGSGTLELYNSSGTLLSPDVNGFYQLGTVAKNTTGTYRVRADYSTCETDTLLFLVGWECDGYPASLSTLTCDPDTVALSISPVSAQISVVVTDLATTPTDPADPSSPVFGTDSILICEDFPVEFQLNSALPGALNNVFALMDVPVSAGQGGLEYLAGSGTFEYPIGSTPKPFPAAAEAALLAQNGGAQFLLDWSQIADGYLNPAYELPGVYAASANRSAIIRLNMRPTCELPVGDHFTIRAFATYGCGGAATGFGESLAGDDLNVTGVFPDYQTVITVSEIDTFSSYNSVNPLRITLQKNGTNPVTNGDSIVLRLPEGLSYDSWGGCISGNCPDPDSVHSYVVNNQEFHIWPMPEMNDGEEFEFEINLKLDDNVLGSLGLIEVQTRNQQFLSCVAEPGGLCTTPGVVLSGSGSRAASAYLPAVGIEITGLVANQYQNSVYAYTTSLMVLTSDQTAPDGFWVELYCADVDDQISTGSAPADSVFFPGPITAGSILDTTVTILADCDPHDFGVLAMIPDTLYSGRLTQGFSPLFNGLNRGALLAGGNPFDIAEASMILLPLEWISVDALRDGNKARIHWVVAQDAAPQYFEVERSTAGGAFSVVGKTDGKAGLTGQYQWTDRQLPGEAVVVYRIRAVDANGDVLMSPRVELTTEASLIGLQVLENPVTEVIRLELSVPASGGELSLWSVQGQEIWRTTLVAEDRYLDIPAGNFATGMYLIRLNTTTGQITRKIEIRE